MNPHSRTCIFFVSFVFLAFAAIGARAGGGNEFIGQFEPGLVANDDDFERVVLKAETFERFKGRAAFSADAHLATGQIMNPETQQYSLLAVLVELKGNDPELYVDLNGDYNLTNDEKFVLKREKEDDPYLWITTLQLPLKEGFFKTCPVFIRYFRSVRSDKMGPDDRLLTQSTEVLARGAVDVRGKRIAVEYEYDLHNKRLDPQNGLLGVDADGDGKVDIANLSPESTKADNESVVFRVGDIYLSTKRADLGKNQIVLRENEAKDYKRVELYMGKEFPEFNFTDFDNKKHRISDYRGKFVLLDIWGFWCGPCRKELPYIREANKRFAARNLVVVGLNTDEGITIDSLKKSLTLNQMTWEQGQYTSVVDFLRSGLRINSFPTTFLISPDGKILSMGRSEKDEPDLRGEDLLETLDKILPKG